MGDVGKVPRLLPIAITQLLQTGGGVVALWRVVSTCNQSSVQLSLPGLPWSVPEVTFSTIPTCQAWVTCATCLRQRNF